MILFQLRCGNGHEFEAWFRDSASYDLQVVGTDVGCPYCSDTNVCKAVMAPNIATGRSMRGTEQEPVAEGRAREVAEQILDAVGTLRQQVEKNCDNVGDQFATEARRIHYGEAEERGICGEATDDEASDLDDEGIEFFKLPMRPRRND